MSFSLLPELMVERLTDLTPELLHRYGIRLLMMDFDNTIVPYTTDVPEKNMADWLRNMLESDVLICVVSNSRNCRVPAFCQKYGLPCITHAKKPGTRGVRQCLEQFQIPENEAALVGDQIYTDTLAANRAGVMPILVQAIDNHNIWLKLRHVAELPFIFAARKRRVAK